MADGLPHLTEPSTTRLEDVSSASLVEGDGFEPSVLRVMDGDLGRQVPALIAVFELAGTAVALQRGPKVVWPHRHPEFP